MASSATSRCSTERQLLGYDEFHAAAPKSVFTEDGKYLKKLPDDYYATKTYTDKLISFIEAGRGDGKPFFAYVSHQAPHDPYHLPRTGATAMSANTTRGGMPYGRSG